MLTTVYLVNYILLSILQKQLHKVTEINKTLGMCRIKITISNNSTLSVNSELKISIFGA